MNRAQRIIVGLIASVAFAGGLYCLMSSKFYRTHVRGTAHKIFNNYWGVVCLIHFELAVVVGYCGPVNFGPIPPRIRLALKFTIECVQHLLEIVLIVNIGERLPDSGSNIDWRLMLSSALFALYCIFFSLIAQHHVRFSMTLAFTKLGLHMAFGYEGHRKKAIALWGLSLVMVLMVTIWHEHRAQGVVLDVHPEAAAAEIEEGHGADNDSDDSNDPDYEPGEEEKEEAEEEEEEELVEEYNEFEIVERDQNQNQQHNGEWIIQIGEILREVPAPQLAPQLAALAVGMLNYLADMSAQRRIGN